MTDRLRFGIFMAPFHQAGENPTLAIERDLELIAHLDRLGWDEAWIGEHHSAGTEIIASPEIFIAAAAERTRHIKLGTGVISVAYHNPLHGRRARRPARPPDPRPLHARRRAGLAADRRDHARPRPDRDPPAAGGGPRRHHAPAARPRSRCRATTKMWNLDRRPPAPAAVLRPAVRRRRPGRGLAVGPTPGRQVRRRAAVDRRHPGRRLRRARPALGRDGGARRDVRHGRRPRQVAARRPDAHRRDQGAGRQGRRVRHPRSGSTTSSTPRPSRRWTSAAPTRRGR